MENLTFEHWFDIFYDKVKSLGYSGRIDKESFEIDFENGLSPEKSAKDFVSEMED